MSSCGLDSACWGLTCGPVAGCCVYCNEPSGSVRTGLLLGLVSNFIITVPYEVS
jgi:hypothetical protein